MVQHSSLDSSLPKSGHPILSGVSADVVHHGIDFVVQSGGQCNLEAGVYQPLDRNDSLAPASSQVGGKPSHAVIELGMGKTAIRQAQAHRVGAGDPVAG